MVVVVGGSGGAGWPMVRERFRSLQQVQRMGSAAVFAVSLAFPAGKEGALMRQHKQMRGIVRSRRSGTYQRELTQADAFLRMAACLQCLSMVNGVYIFLGSLVSSNLKEAMLRIRFIHGHQQSKVKEYALLPRHTLAKLLCWVD
jgi:hypothetical protein